MTTMIPKTLTPEFKTRVSRNCLTSSMDLSRSRTKIRPNKKFAFFGYRALAKKVMSVDSSMSMIKTSCLFADFFRSMDSARRVTSAYTSTRSQQQIPVFRRQTWTARGMNHVHIMSADFATRDQNADSINSISLSACQDKLSCAKIIFADSAHLAHNASGNIWNSS